RRRSQPRRSASARTAFASLSPSTSTSKLISDTMPNVSPLSSLVQSVVPAIGILRETGALYAYNAEPLSSRGLHHDPALQVGLDSSSQRLQTCDLGGNIVSFNVNMHPTLMFNALNLHDRFVWRRGKHSIVATGAWMIEIYRTAKHICPELGSLIYV